MEALTHYICMCQIVVGDDENNGQVLGLIETTSSLQMRWFCGQKGFLATVQVVGSCKKLKFVELKLVMATISYMSKERPNILPSKLPCRDLGEDGRRCRWRGMLVEEEGK